MPASGVAPLDPRDTRCSFNKSCRRADEGFTRGEEPVSDVPKVTNISTPHSESSSPDATYSIVEESQVPLQQESGPSAMRFLYDINMKPKRKAMAAYLVAECSLRSDA